MSDQPGKLVPISLEGFEFENDFGQSPVGLGHFSKDQGFIAVASLVGAFVGAAIAGVPLFAVILAVGLNDIKYAGSNSNPEKAADDKPQLDQKTIEVPAEAVVEDETQSEETAASDSVQDRPADPLPVQSAPKTTKALPPFDRDRVINESKGSMIIGDMGAAKTCVAQYIANGFDEYGIIVFDPHGKTDWGNAYVITKMGAIYRQMAILLDLLENGDETPLLIICDEWIEIRGDRRNKEKGDYKGLADDFIRLFSTKPRKFNKLAAFVLHSPNVEAAGVDSFLRENYLKVYLGRLAKKEFPHIQDCAYPCVLEDEQQEHPTHGHHTEFKPKNKAPRNLQPLNSTPITIPLAYMDGDEVKVCDRGWSDGQLRLDVTNIRNQLEMLYRDTDIDTSYQEEANEGDTEPDTSDIGDTSIDTGNSDTSDTADTTGGSGDTSDTRPIAQRLSKKDLVSLIERMKAANVSQTQIIHFLWDVEKNRAGWKQAYAEYKELTDEG